MEIISKYASDVLDYGWDFEDWLESGDTISSVAWTLDSGITKDSQSNTDTIAKCVISGGTAGTSYMVKCVVTTAESRSKTRYFRLDVLTAPEV